MLKGLEIGTTGIGVGYVVPKSLPVLLDLFGTVSQMSALLLTCGLLLFMS